MEPLLLIKSMAIYGNEQIVGNGNIHLVSPKNNMEAGGDQVDYWGEENGKAVITGNAWAVQDNNTLKSKKLTVYLADDGNKAKSVKNIDV